MDDTTNPPFILCYVADFQGSGYARIQLPLASLVSGNLADGRVEMQPLPSALLQVGGIDTVVFQRQVELAQHEQIQLHRQILPNAFFVAEFDDYLGKIPAKSFHNGFLPAGLEERVATTLSLCDAATTTTEPLAAWLRELGGKDVRVIPNVVPLAQFKSREPRPGAKLRIGWAGGISHAGDIELLNHALRDIGDEVTWVFFGMQPENPPCKIEFHPGTAQPHEFITKLASLDLDLALAPLEDNRFNECKSNLRLLESGAAGAAVIAQRMTPYLLNEPPVFSYADTPEDWTREIKRFIATPASERSRRTHALQAWVSRHYTAERRLKERLAAWSPATTDVAAAWRPRAPKPALEDVVLVVQGTAAWVDLPPELRALTPETRLDEGYRRAIARGAHLLWLRPGVQLSEAAWRRLRGALSDQDPIAGAVPVASDGVNAYPVPNTHTPVTPATARLTDTLLAERFGDTKLAVAALSGPCILLHRAALALFGAPDAIGQTGHDELAIMEWSLRVHQKTWRLVQVAGAYAPSAFPPQRTGESAMLRLHARGLARWLNAPTEAIAAVDREGLDFRLARANWAGAQPGVMGFDSGYPTWALFRDDLAKALPRPALADVLTVAAYGAPLPTETPWVLLLEDGTTLKPGARALLQHHCARADLTTQAIYGDHELTVADGAVPFFKTDFDLELLLAQDYITPVVAVRAAHLPGLTLTGVRDPAQLYEHLLVLARAGGRENLQHRIRHIPEILATRAVESPESVAVTTMQRQVTLETCYGDQIVVAMHEALPGTLKVTHRWDTVRAEPPLVSIIVPTLGDGWLLQPCLNTILKLTNYQNYEIIVVSNGAKPPEIGDLAAADPRVHVIEWPHPFNWSAQNNFAVRHARCRGDYLCFMNDDVRVVAPKWLDLMLGHAVQEDIGAVGARLIYPHGLVQHVGVVAHNGIYAHIHKGIPINQPGAYGWAMLSHEATAVTAACMLVSRGHYDEVGGFTEQLSHNYNDTHFCMELRKRGYRNVVETAAELLHNESSSRATVLSTEGGERLRTETAWMRAYDASPDPYWNVNLQLTESNYGLSINGLNRDLLAWQDTPPDPRAVRALLINDAPGPAGTARALRESGNVVFAADLSNFTLQVTAPALPNSAGWDIRDPAAVRRGLDALGIGRIVLRSLVGQAAAAPPVESLNGLAAVGVELVVGDAVAPPSPSTMPGAFGLVDIAAWHRAFARLSPGTRQIAEVAE